MNPMLVLNINLIKENASLHWTESIIGQNKHNWKVLKSMVVIGY